tara:strand:- start:3431 stop:4345 length:915 start_codon:yes stop_codon:yes gene_type:complete
MEAQQSVKILIVDDSKATLEIVRRALEAFGYRKLSIKKTNCATEALDLIDSWQPEILLTDWYMPEMTGLDLIAQVRKSSPSIKVAMISTVDDKQQIEQALLAGAEFVLSKPFEDDDLHKALLPLVQGAEEEELLIEPENDVQPELALPKLSQLAKLLTKVIGGDVEIHNVQLQQFDESKVPCLMAVYEDSETQRLKAVALLDIYAICVFSRGSHKVTEVDIQTAIHKKIVSKRILDSCHKVLEQSSIAFLDSNSRKSLRLKSVNFITKPFDKLKSLYEKEPATRLDFSCQLNEMAQGKVTLVGF